MVPPCENYLPENPAAADENEGAGGDMPAFDENPLNGNLNDDVMPNPENGNNDRVIEKLREKIIEQNAIFREQLFQLHHAYKVQENMMDVFKMKGPLKGLIPIDASLMIPVLDQIPSEITNMIPPNNHLPEKSTSDVGIAIAGTDDFKMPLNILQVNDAGRSSVFLPPNVNGVSLKDAASSNSKVAILRKRKFSRVLEAADATESSGSLTPMVNSVLLNNGEPSELRSAKFSKWMSVNALKENEAVKSSVSPVPEQHPMQLEDSEPSDPRTKEFIDRVSSIARKVFAERMSLVKCVPKENTDLLKDGKSEEPKNMKSSKRTPSSNVLKVTGALDSSASPLRMEDAVMLNDAESAQLKKRKFSKGMSSLNAVKVNGAVESSVSPAPTEDAVFLNDNESVGLKKIKLSESMSSSNILKMNDATYSSLSLVPRENAVWLKNGKSADSKTRELSKRMSSNTLKANNANHSALYSVPMVSGLLLKEGESSDRNRLASNNLRENDGRNGPVLATARVNEVLPLADKLSDTKMIVSPKWMSVTSIKAYARSKPVSLVPKVDGVLLQDGESSGSKKRKRRRRVIDLELPAEAYMDMEDTDVSEEDDIKPSDNYEAPVYYGSEIMHQNDETLTLGIDANPSSSAFHLQSSSHLQNLLPTQRLADSNKPAKDACKKRTRSPIQRNFVGTKGNNMEVQEYGNLATSNPNTLGQQMAVVKDKHEGEGTDSNCACANNKRKREFPLFGSGAGQSGNTGCSFSLDLFTQGSLGSSVKNEHISANATENAKINPHFANRKYSRSSVSQIGTPFFVPDNEYPDSAYPMVSTSRKSVSSRSHGLAAGQPLPSFTGFSPTDVQGGSSKSTSQNQNLSNAGASQAPPKFTGSAVTNAQGRSSISTSQNQYLGNAGASEAHSNFTGFPAMNVQGGSSTSTSQNLIFGKDWGKWLSEAVKFQSNREKKSSLHLNAVVSGSHSAPSHLQPTSSTLAGSNLKQFGNNLASGSTEVYQRQTKLAGKRSKNGAKNQLVVHNQIHAQLDKAISDMERRLGVDSGGFISFRRKRQSNELDENNAVGYHQMRSSNLMVAPEKEWKRQKTVSSSMTMLPDSTKALEVKERKHEKKYVSAELNCKGGLHFPVADQVQQNALDAVPIAHSTLSLSSSSKNNDMNGNLTIGLSSEIKAGSSKERMRSVNLLSGTQPRDDTEVNKSHGCMSSSGILDVSQKPPKSNEVVPFLLPAPPSFSAKASAGNQGKHRMLSQSTSDTTVQLPPLKAKSSKNYACINDPVLTAAAASILALSSDTTTCPLPPSSCDPLLWFAEIASSMEHTAVPNDDVKEYSEDDGWFEAMTLQLEEVKEEEYKKWTRPVRVETADDGEKNYTSLLFTKRRRGAPRGRRQQRREFRSEVLPSIVTLSRQEVAEDFQNIGAMMKAEGFPWPLSSSTRGRGRNRRGRGRLAARNVSYAEDDPATDPGEVRENKRATQGGRGRRGRRGRR